MSNPYLAEIRLVSFNFAPNGWAMCNGQILAINQNQALFSLIGTFYGGDGVTNFQLPNLQGRVMVGMGSNTLLGESSGVESVSLTIPQIPDHSHLVLASLKAASSVTPAGMVPAVSPALMGNVYGSVPSSNVMDPNTVSPAGEGQPHDNRMPSLTMNYVIALLGIYPTRN